MIYIISEDYMGYHRYATNQKFLRARRITTVYDLRRYGYSLNAGDELHFIPESLGAPVLDSPKWVPFLRTCKERNIKIVGKEML